MKRKKLALFSIMLLSALFVGGAFASAADVVEVRLAGITMTSDTYQLGVAWSNMVKKYLPGVNLTVLAKGGTSKLLRGVANKQWEIGYIGSPHMECAKKGIHNLRVVQLCYPRRLGRKGPGGPQGQKGAPGQPRRLRRHHDQGSP
ncbi:MAG: hypothetical protein P8X90_19515 [Desulfobacterales bacterium]